MASLLDIATGAVDHPNVRRFLDMLASAEGTTKNGYNTAFGGGYIQNLAAHPGTSSQFTQTDGKANSTTAAGRYQFIKPTWNDVAGKLRLPDFGPRAQDLAAVELIRRAGALQDVLSGNFHAAVQKTGSTWASLPSSNYAQPKRSMAFINNALGTDNQQVNVQYNPKKDPLLAQWDSLPTRKASGASTYNPAKDPLLAQWDGAGEAPKQNTAQPSGNSSSLLAFGASAGRSFGQGMLALQQIAGKGLSAIGADGVGDWLQKDAVEGSKNLQAQAAPYEQGHGAAKFAGDMTGMLANPVNRLIPMSGAAGGNLLMRAAAQGAITGATAAPTADAGDNASFISDKIKQAGFGAAGGAAGAAAGNLLTKAIGGFGSDAAKALHDKGVSLTPGQALGGVAKSLEDKATSIPILGDAIQNARQRGIASFNRAAYNDALKPIGQKLEGGIGQDAVAEASSKIGKAYDSVIGKMKLVADKPFIQDMANAGQLAQALPEAQQKQFLNLIRTQIAGKVNNGGVMDGKTLQGVMSTLRSKAASYMGDGSVDNREMGKALMGVVDIMNNHINRVNAPELVQAKAAADAAWAQFARLRGAASAAGNNEGVFMPSQLMAQVKRGDKSVGKGTFAKGEALMQELASQGQQVLPSKVPDSGTAGRSAMILGLGALGGAVPQIGLGGAAGIGLGSLAYSAPVNRLTQGLLMTRPQLMQQGGNALSGLIAPAMPLVPQALTH